MDKEDEEEVSFMHPFVFVNWNLPFFFFLKKTKVSSLAQLGISGHFLLEETRKGNLN